MALLLLRILLDIAQPVVGPRFQDLEERVGGRGFEVRGAHARLGDQLFLQLADLDHFAVGEHDRLEHLVFGNLLAEALDHQDRFFAAGDDQVERAGLELRLRRQHDQPAVDQADPHRRDRIVEGNRRDAQGGTGTGRGMDVGIVFLIAGQHVGHDLNFVGKPSGKRGRSGRSVSRALNTSRVVGRPSRFKKPPAKRPGGGHSLPVIDGEREEIDPGRGAARIGRRQKQPSPHIEPRRPRWLAWRFLPLSD